MLLLLLTACVATEASWDLFEAVEVEASVAEADASGEVDPRFAEALEREADAEDPWGTEAEDGADAEPVDDGSGEDGVAQVEADVEDDIEAVEQVVEAPEAAPAPDLPAPSGLSTEQPWGLRLVATLPQANPPRAAIGLPGGEEIVVSPGSMLPEVGVVVMAVGDGTVQLAQVRPNGDHALVNTVVLQAQYGSFGASSAP